MWKEKIKQAHSLIKKEIRQTPLEYSPSLSKLSGAEVFLKLENYQLSGSFKIRGVMNKLLSLTDAELQKGLVACSTGNHGAAFAYALDKFDYEGLLFLPTNVSKTKLEALRNYEVELDFFGEDCVDTEQHGRNYALSHDKIFFSPYNDETIVAGQGTIGFEIINQMEHPPDAVIAPVGGGGLISGLGVFLKGCDSNIQVIGCQPINSAVMHESLKVGRVVELESLPTLSDATAGGIEKDSITFEMCQQFVDDIILLPEEDIKTAIKLLVKHHQMIVEGAAAMTLATLLSQPNQFRGKKVVLILSGKKLSETDLLKSLV